MFATGLDAAEVSLFGVNTLLSEAEIVSETGSEAINFSMALKWEGGITNRLDFFFQS
ncbi:hypothetical protein GCM10008083_31120 [Ulvibacter litoralis]|nr:hypothetical protein GCM10008083_31120 [Ulvibacter litoralis]